MDGARQALSLLNETFEHDGPSLFRRRALEHVRRVADYDHAVFVSYTDEFFAAPPPYVARYLSSPAYRSSLSRAFRASRAQRGCYVDTEIYSTRERREMRFFRDITAPFHIRAQLVSVVHFGGRVSGVIHLNREGRPYGADDLARLRPLLTVIGAAHNALEPSGPAPAAPPSYRLSPREREVAALVARGLTNRAIAASLGKSVWTVRHQVESILGKCGASSRAAVASLVGRGVLLEPTTPRLPAGVDERVFTQAWDDMRRSIPR